MPVKRWESIEGCVTHDCQRSYHDDVIKWKHFAHYWSFVRGIHRSPVNSPHKGQRRGALMLPMICVWINGWVNNCKAGALRRHRAHYDVTVMHWRIHIWLSYRERLITLMLTTDFEVSDVTYDYGLTGCAKITTLSILLILFENIFLGQEEGSQTKLVNSLGFR